MSLIDVVVCRLFALVLLLARGERSNAQSDSDFSTPSVFRSAFANTRAAESDHAFNVFFQQP